MKYKTTFQVAGGIFLLSFLTLTYIVRFHISWLSGFDQTITRIIRTPYPAWNGYQLFITKLGNPLIVILIFLGGFLFLWWQKKRPEMIWFASNFLVIAGIINPLVKLLIMRARPTIPHLVTETSYSFPSGHAAGSMILYGSLFFLMPILVRKKRLCTLLQFVMAFIIISVGISRIYLGVHYPSDITGGFLLSLSWLCLTYPIYKQYTQLSKHNQ